MRDLTVGRLAEHARAMVPAAVGGYFLLVGFEIVDAFWAGRMEEKSKALAALAVGTYALWALYSLGAMVENGTLALVARAVGAKQTEAARRTGWQGVGLACIVWLATVCIFVPLVPRIVAFTDVEPAARRLAEGYLEILLWGAGPLYLFAALEAVFRAFGDTRTPMRILLVSLIANALLDPWFIFGGFGLAPKGLAGAAWATVATRFGAVIAAYVILRRRGLLSPTPSDVFRHFERLVRMARIGLPSGAAGFLYCVTFLLLTRQLARHGSDAIGAFMVGQKAESMSWGALVGLSVVSQAWMGQNLGAGLIDRAGRGAWRLAAVGVVIAAICASIFWLLPDPLIDVFAPDQPGVLTFGRSYLAIIAVSQVFLAVEIIFQASFAGAGDTMPPMIVIAPLTLLRAPAAWYADEILGHGPAGIFWVVTLSTVVKGILLACWFRTRRWAHRGMLATSGD